MMQCTLSALAAFLAPALPTAQEDPSSFEVRLAAIMDDASDPEACSPKAARGRIGQLGCGAVPAVLERLRVADPGETEILLDALPLFSRASVSDAVRARLDAGVVPTDWRVGALRALGTVGREGDVELAVETSTVGEGMGASLSSELEAAARLILTRDPHAVQRAVNLASTVDVGSAVALVRAHRTAPPSMTLEPLAGLLQQRAEISLAVLAEIGRAGLRGAAPPPTIVSERVRALLESEDVATLREAALAAGRLGDFAAVARLIELLEHEVGGVRASAHQGLRDLTGLGLGAEAGCWRGWLEKEAEWHRSRGREMLARLTHEVDATKLREMLREVALHRYGRHEMAEAITPLLQHQDHTVRASACAALSQLGSARGLAALVPLLDDRAELAAEAAWSALRALTGEKLPRERGAWETLLAARL